MIVQALPPSNERAALSVRLSTSDCGETVENQATVLTGRSQTAWLDYRGRSHRDEGISGAWSRAEWL
jgi:hypothetical protein